MEVYFVKVDGKYYYCGYNKCHKSIHKANFYKTQKYAEESASDLRLRPMYKDAEISVGIANINEVDIMAARQDLQKENAELKRLLKFAIEDMNILWEAGKDEGCLGIEFKWRYADEAMKLIKECILED